MLYFPVHNLNLNALEKSSFWFEKGWIIFLAHTETYLYKNISLKKMKLSEKIYFHLDFSQ